MKKFISFSGGVESSAMCILYGNYCNALFCDTGAEHKEMYKRIDFIEQEVKKLHPNFKVIRIKPTSKVKGKIYTSLLDRIEGTNYLPSIQRRYCTNDFKIKPLDKFLKKYKSVELLIGLNAEEGDRAIRKKGKTITYKYPLLHNDIDRDDCKGILKAYNLLPDFPPYMQRGGCIICPFKSKKEYKAMVHFSIEEAQEVARIEKTIQTEGRKKQFRIKQDMKPMVDIIKQEQNNLFGDLKQFYSKQEKNKSCGLFCHR